MTKTQALLLLFMEECDEASQRASKAIRFTTEEVQPGQDLTNSQRVVYEFNDIVAVMEELHDEGVIDKILDIDAIQKKREKIIEWLEYSKKCGTVNF